MVPSAEDPGSAKVLSFDTHMISVSSMPTLGKRKTRNFLTKRGYLSRSTSPQGKISDDINSSDLKASAKWPNLI